MEAVTLILLPEPSLTGSSSAKLISDNALAAEATGVALDYVEGPRRSSLRKQASSALAISSSRKSSKRDSRTVLIVEPDIIVSCDEYFAALDEAQAQQVAKLRRRYDSIGPLLIKLESLVLGTATGESFKMRLYYQHWEGATFSGLVRLVRNNLSAFIDALDGEQEPLFQVDAQLMLPEIILRPTPNEIYEIIFQSVKDFLRRIRALRRWLPGSCIYFDDTQNKTKDAQGDGDDPPNFIDDVLGDESVAQLLVKIQAKVRDLVHESKKYLIR